MLAITKIASTRWIVPVTAWWSQYDVLPLITVASPPIFAHQSRNVLREPSAHVDRLWIIAIVEYVVMDVHNFYAAAHESRIGDGLNADSLLGSGVKLFPLQQLVRQLVGRLGFFDILSGTALD